MENRIRKIRHKHQMTIKEVIEELKKTQNISITEHHLANIENERIGFSVKLLVALANLFNVSADYILKLSDDEKRSREKND